MKDPRLFPDPARVTQSTAGRIHGVVCDLNRHPDGPRDRQLIYGQSVTVLSQQDGWSYVQSNQDGYVGYVETRFLDMPVEATHRVKAPCTHAYSAPDFKSRDQAALSHNSMLAALSETDKYIETELGFVPKTHLCSVSTLDTDPAEVAHLYLGTDYLWGGNSRWGIDCSGLVQAACHACGLACPGDSDQQQSSLGTALLQGTAYRRNDLLFWKGHVALVYGPDMLIHANAHAMAVAFEPLQKAIDRIAKTDGPVLAHRRLPC